MTVTFTAKPAAVERVISAVLPHASIDRTLPVINCVRVEIDKDEFLAVATDRYSLGVCRASLSKWDSDAKKVKKIVAHLRVADVKRLFEFLKPTRGLSATWKLAEDSLSVATSDGESLSIRLMHDETAFPDWRQLMTSNARSLGPAEVMGFTPDIVEHFRKTAKALGELHFTWHFASPLKPALIQIGDSFVGLLMPVRISDRPALDLSVFGIEAPKAVTAA